MPAAPETGDSQFVQNQRTTICFWIVHCRSHGPVSMAVVRLLRLPPLDLLPALCYGKAFLTHDVARYQCLFNVVIKKWKTIFWLVHLIGCPCSQGNELLHSWWLHNRILCGVLKFAYAPDPPLTSYIRTSRGKSQVSAFCNTLRWLPRFQSWKSPWGQVVKSSLYTRDSRGESE